jgi:hypothetical protein
LCVGEKTLTNLLLLSACIEVKQFRCFAHVLNLAAQAALGIIRPEIDELREFINKIRGVFEIFQQSSHLGLSHSVELNF